jgi:Mg2+ and Co2+ transporter CorA
MHNVEDVSSKDLWSCERDIHSLSDIIEDQYVSFEALVSLSYVAIESQDNFQLRGLIKGFEPLDKAMLRLENKAESLRLHYMLFQQEKSTKKINLLTIVQAVFVPLTFIAGVYGMNFINMPELNWRLGYLYVWFAFIALASLLLLYFYRKGWFD